MSTSKPVTSSTRKKPVRAQDVQLRGKAAQEAKALQARMAEHREGYEAYKAARRAGNGTQQEQNRPAYTNYKRAYAALLKLRHAEAAKQDAKSGDA